MLKLKINNRGFGVIEALVGAGIITFSMLGVLGIFQQLIRVSNDNLQTIKAGFLIEEGLEAMRLIRDSSWDDNIKFVLNDTPYYLSFDDSTNTWSFSGLPTSYIDGLFERVVDFDDVYRDNSTYDIVANGGAGSSLDVNTVKINVRVGWRNSAGATTTKAIDAYLTNLFLL